MPKFPAISEEMRRWCALIEAEVLTWPEIKARPMFGLTAFYRKDRIFAAIPKTRTMGQRDSVIFKLLAAPAGLVQRALAHPRVVSTQFPAGGWIEFELESVNDVREALRWLSHAHECSQTNAQKAFCRLMGAADA
jgi:hypothetical protein